MGEGADPCLPLAVLGRAEASAFLDAHPSWALISIRGTGTDDRPGPRARGPVLRLQFDDVSILNTHYEAPKPSHAAAIALFARSLKPGVPGLVAHCAAGVSRSSAALAGVVWALGARDVVGHLEEARRRAEEGGWRETGIPLHPNRRLVGLLDLELGAGGELLAAVWDSYGRLGWGSRWDFMAGLLAEGGRRLPTPPG